MRNVLVGLLTGVLIAGAGLAWSGVGVHAESFRAPAMIVLDRQDIYGAPAGTQLWVIGSMDVWETCLGVVVIPGPEGKTLQAALSPVALPPAQCAQARDGSPK